MPTPDELKQQFDSLQARVEELLNSVAPLQEAKKKSKDEEQAAYVEYQNKVAEIRSKTSGIDEKIYEINSMARLITEEARRAERAYKLALEEQDKLDREAARLADLAVLEEKWDQLTASAPWRPNAKAYQIEGAHYLTQNRKVILADTMGLGKTLTSIVACDMVEAATRHADPQNPFLGEEQRVWNSALGQHEIKIVNGVNAPAGKRVLYFCPNSLLTNVMDEFRKWAPHRSVTYIGGATKSERQFILDFVVKPVPEWVVICNFEAWRKDLSLIQSLADLEPDVIIIDEAHNIKDIKSIAYRGIKQLIDTVKPSFVYPMTGTPILNRPQDLFAMLTLVAPDIFYDIKDFLYTFCEQDSETGYWKFQPGGMDRIARKIGKNYLRRTRETVGLQLPEKTIILHEIEVDEELYPHQAKAREQMRKHAMIMIDEREGKAITAAAMIAVFTRLRQIETWPAGIQVKDPITKEIKFSLDVKESQKIDYIIRQNPETKEWDGLIPEFIEDERGVLFSQFKEPLNVIANRLIAMGKRPVVFDGDTPKDLKDEIRRNFDRSFNEEPKWDIVLANYKVGGVGLNLTAATQMIILDEEWNPGKRDQAYDRIHRIGQESAVTIHVVRTDKTIDSWLAGIIEHKEGVVDGFNRTMDDTVEEFRRWLDGE